MVDTSDIKWIKLYTNIFDNRKIKQIETLPDGDTILIIWLKLLTLAGVINDSGLVYLTKDIPYTEETLATAFSRPLNTVKLALNVFQTYGMIEIVDDFLMVSNWEEYQNIEGMEKVREQNRIRNIEYRKRKKEKLLTCNVTNDVNVTSHDATDIDIEEDKEKKKNINNKPPKHKYGEYNHVLLTDEEYKKLSQDYSNVEELITYLDEYIEMKGYKAKSHYLAIKKWVVDAVSRNKPKDMRTEKLETYDNSKNCTITEEELQAFKELRGEHD